MPYKDPEEFKKWKRRYQGDRFHAHRMAKTRIRKNMPGALVEWASEKKIKAIYKMCAELSLRTGIKHSVDHIVPLFSDEVCGLHWEGNLQIMDDRLNKAKGCDFVRDDNTEMFSINELISTLTEGK